VRGSPRDLRVAGDIVAVLDTPPAGRLPKVSSLRAFKLRFAKAEGLAQILESLEVKARAVPIRRTNMLIVGGSDEVLKEIGDLVKELDVEGKGPDGAGEDK
jgi:type II secretory pathway component GspD/PulD (secretin)